MLDTKKLFPIRSYTHTNPFTHEVTVGYTRSAMYEGKTWSDADINYYEALHKLEEQIVYTTTQNAIDQLIDESLEIV